MTDAGQTLREAVEAVRELGLDPDSAGGAAALSYLLGGPRPATTSSQPAAPLEAASSGLSDEEPAGRVAEWVGAETAAIKDYIEFDETRAAPRPPSSRLHRSKAERQRLLTLLTLAVNRVGYGSEEVAAVHVNAVAAEYACLDQNLPHNVAKRGDLVTRRGKRGAFVYRATQPGLERARELLRSLLTDSGPLEV